jgi:ribosomal protein S18 acetylase RimI-like enzyme
MIVSRPNLNSHEWGKDHSPRIALENKGPVSPAAQIELRPFRASDRARIFKLLSVLPSLYPDGAAWLDRRLNDVLARKARCTVAVAGPHIVGTTIESPKGHLRTKLSTIYVHPNYRRRNIGTRLLTQCRSDWFRESLDTVYVTLDLQCARELLPLFTLFGFKFEALELERYGAERHEMVLRWKANVL